MLRAFRLFEQYHSFSLLQCVKACLSRSIIKPGDCPRNDSTLSPFASVCMETCHQDGQCPALTKCCRHHCGVTCQTPENLDMADGK